MRLPWLTKATLGEQGSLAEQMEEAKAKYRLRAKLWCGAASPAEEASAQPRKRHRTSAFEWLLLCDSTLRLNTAAAGFDHYRIAENDDRHPLQWPFLKVALDQGSDGWSAMAYLLDRQCNVEASPDLAHGANNDLKGVAKDLGLWQHELCMAVAYNLNQAPWGSARDIGSCARRSSRTSTQ